MRTYKFKLYPTKVQKDSLNINLNVCRFVYNKMLETYYKYDEQDIKLSGYDLSKFISYWKKEKYPFLKNYHSKMLQPITKQINTNLKRLKELKKKRKVGTLRFKSKNRFSSFTYHQNGFIVLKTDKRYNKLFLSKIGLIRFKQSREIKGKIKQITIKKKPSGWYCNIVTNGHCEYKNLQYNKIGIDMGVKTFITTSNNQTFRNPLFMNEQLSKIKVLHRQLSKTLKGSKNRRKVINKLLRLFEKIYNQKQDYFHKISTQLVRNNIFLVLEDLDIKSMTNKKKRKNKHYNMRNILDSSWATFINMLKIKVSSTESEIIFVNPRNTSKMCSNCGNIKEDLTLSDRTYFCRKCELSLDRDYNASINILKLGKELTFVGGETLVSLMNQEALLSSSKTNFYKNDNIGGIK